MLPTFNRRGIIVPVLEKLFNQDFPKDAFEIIVVVDGSTDGTAALLRTLRPRCQFRVIEQANLGPAAARNTGFHAAEGELLIFLDDDMISDPALVLEHVVAQRQEPNTVCIGAVFLSADSTRTIASECFERELGIFPLLNRRTPGLPLTSSYWVFGNASIRRRILQSCGGFDERFRLKEDLELAYRLVEMGVNLRYTPTAVAEQYYCKTPAELLREAVGFAAADILMLSKHPEYAPKSPLRTAAVQPSWKRAMKAMLASAPVATDAVLRRCWHFAELLGSVSSPARRVGARLLQFHRGLIWYRSVLFLLKRPGFCRQFLPDS